MSASSFATSARACLSALLVLFAAAFVAACQPHAAPAVTVRNAWASATPPNATVGAAYLEILAADGDTLLSASTPVASRVEMHLSQEENGRMTMRPLPSVQLKPREPFRFEPGGAHLMLIGLAKPLEAGSRFPLTLRLQQAGEITIEVEVTSSPPHAH
jgi:periplasmic copper chaperone A